MPAAAKPSASNLRAAFETPVPFTIGLEEELMLLHPETLDLLPRGPEVVERAADERMRLELPAAQVEIAAPPARTVAAAAESLRDGRRVLARAAEGIGLLAGAGAHPFGGPFGELTPGERYERTAREYGCVARRQLVFGLHVHVAVPGADTAVAVHNALRSYLPEIAALAANAPFHAGEDTGLASVRPKISQLLPRQGIPPAVPSIEALAEAIEWGVAAGRLPDASQWWWEARLHPTHGTVEVRAPDAQATIADTTAIGALVHCLCAWLAERHDAGEPLPVAPTWRIQENSWAACRYGMDGVMADLETGAPVAVRERIEQLAGQLAPVADKLGCAAELARVPALAARNGAAAQREQGAARAAARYLADRFLADDGS